MSYSYHAYIFASRYDPLIAISSAAVDGRLNSAIGYQTL